LTDTVDLEIGSGIGLLNMDGRNFLH
jgi:hypothetical protein